MIRSNVCQFAVLLCALCANAPAQENGLLPNPQFNAGLQGWVFRPGGPEQAAVVDGGAERGRVLELHPNGKLLGVETERLSRAQFLKPDQPYRVESLLKNDGLQKGVFAFSMYCFDAGGKPLKQIAFYSLTAQSKPHDWRTLRGEFGPGTKNPLPAGTESVCIRFSFHEASGDCRGRVLVDDVVLQPFTPDKKDAWPNEIVAAVGDLQIRFESRSFWTLYRIDFQGTRLCIDRFGSHYGSVANFPGVGFIGSGHTENEDEQVVDLKLFVDGKPVEKPEPNVRCQAIRLQKRSRIRAFTLDTDVRVEHNHIVEDVRLAADQATPMTLIYHFMHPWTPTATHYCAELLDGTRIDGAFNGDNRQKIDKATRWSAVYDGPSAKGAVTYVLDAPTDDDWRTRYWDTPDRYRKHYFVTFLGQTVPAGKEFHYRVATVPFAAAAEQWQAVAARVAETCKPLLKNGPQ